MVPGSLLINSEWRSTQLLTPFRGTFRTTRNRPEVFFIHSFIALILSTSFPVHSTKALFSTRYFSLANCWPRAWTWTLFYVPAKLNIFSLPFSDTLFGLVNVFWRHFPYDRVRVILSVDIPAKVPSHKVYRLLKGKLLLFFNRPAYIVWSYQMLLLNCSAYKIKDQFVEVTYNKNVNNLPENYTRNRMNILRAGSMGIRAGTRWRFTSGECLLGFNYWYIFNNVCMFVYVVMYDVFECREV